jgi:hypothetical protein
MRLRLPRQGVEELKYRMGEICFTPREAEPDAAPTSTPEAPAAD